MPLTLNLIVLLPANNEKDAFHVNNKKEVPSFILRLLFPLSEKLEKGLEPSTHALRMRCSTN